MTEQELRALIRAAIGRAGAGGPIRGGAGSPSRAIEASLHTATGGHSSHAMFTLAPGDPEGRCMIEPAVACNHCGYCKSYGH